MIIIIIIMIIIDTLLYCKWICLVLVRLDWIEIDVKTKNQQNNLKHSCTWLVSIECSSLNEFPLVINIIRHNFEELVKVRIQNGIWVPILWSHHNNYWVQFWQYALYYYNNNKPVSLLLCINQIGTLKSTKIVYLHCYLMYLECLECQSSQTPLTKSNLFGG